jgi:hypothetical protein
MNAIHPTPRQWELLEVALVDLRMKNNLSNEDEKALDDLIMIIENQ